MRREQEAIVLMVEARGESDRRVVMLSSHGELIDAHAPAARRSQKRFGAALQPGTHVLARWERRREGGITVLEEAQPLIPPPSPDPLERFYAVAHTMETIAAFAREGAEDARLYRLLHAVLERFTAGDPVDPLCRYAESWTLRLSGLLPDLVSCAVCGQALGSGPVAIAPERGAFCKHDAPASAHRLSGEAARWLVATRGAAAGNLPALGLAADLDLQSLLHSLIKSFTDRDLVSWRGLVALRRAARKKGG